MAPRPLRSCALLLLPLAGAGRQEGLPRPPLPGAAVRELLLAPPAGTRVEHFVLEAAPEGARAEAVGMARLVCGPDPEAGAPAGALRLEAELCFFAEETRVVHTERLREGGARGPEVTLVWRELRPGGGRTLLLEGALGGALKSCETARGELVRREHAGGADAFLWLSLLEAAREGGRLAGALRLFQPLAGVFEPLEARVSEAVPDAGGTPERALELLRGGASAGRFVFRGRALDSFRLQAGGPLARAISREDYERLRADRWLHQDEAAQDRVAALRGEAPPR